MTSRELLHSENDISKEGAMMKRIIKDIFAAVGVITVCRAFCDNYEVKRKSGADDVTVPLVSTSWKSLTYADRDEAERILSEMKEAIEKWYYVSVADACDLTGVPSNYSDTKIGWRNLEGASIRTIKTKVATFATNYIGGNEKIVDRYYVSLPDPIKL